MDIPRILRLLNEASLQELTTSLGIESALAARLITSRPITSVDEALAVRGMDATILETWATANGEHRGQPETVPEPSSTTDDTPAATPLTAHAAGIGSAIGATVSKAGQAARDTLGKGVSGLGAAATKGSKAAQDTAGTIPKKFEETTRSHGLFRAALWAGVVTALVTLALTLAILAAISGSLKFATSSQHQAIEREVLTMTAQMKVIREDMDGLRTRMDTLESVADRTVVLENSQQQLSSDLDALRQDAQAQAERTQRFEDFLKELNTLVSALFETQGGAQ